MKTIQFTNNLGHQVGVAYHIFRRSLCVFTQVGDAITEGSSINYLEQIVSAIAQAEMHEITSMRYFDLQTRTGYGPGYYKSRPNPGDFEFDEVLITVRGGIIGRPEWVPTICPLDVCEEFKMFIDGIPHQTKASGQEFRSIEL